MAALPTRYSSSSPHPRFDIDTHEGKRRCKFRSEDPLPGPASRSCTDGSVRGTNQGKNAMLPTSPRRQGVSSVHPQRYQGFDPTFAQGIILYYTPEAICQKRIVRTYLVAVFGGQRSRHTKKIGNGQKRELPVDSWPETGGQKYEGSKR